MGRRCFVCYSIDARDAGGRTVARKHDRARTRTTGQSTTGDQSTDSHLAQVRDARERLGSDSEVVMLEQEGDGMHGPCVTFLSSGGTGQIFPEHEAGAVALASRAQTMTRFVRGEHQEVHRRKEKRTPVRNVSRETGMSIQVFSFPRLVDVRLPAGNDPLSQAALEGPPWSCGERTTALL